MNMAAPLRCPVAIVDLARSRGVLRCAQPISTGGDMRARMTDLVERLAAARTRRGADWPEGPEYDRVVAVMRADHGPAEPDGGPAALDGGSDALDDLADVFGLDEVDALLLWLAAAADLDANAALAYGLLRGHTGLAAASTGLALELAGVPTASAEAVSRFAADGPLRRHGLLETTGAEPWLARGLQVPPPVVAALAGAEPADPAVAPLRCAVTPLSLPGGEQVRRGLESGAHLVWVRGPVGSAPASLAAGAIATIGLRWLAVDARRGEGAQLADVMGRAAREAGLRGRALLVTGGDALAAAGDLAVFRRLAESPVPVVVAAHKPWSPQWLPRLPLLVDAEPLSPADRTRIWEHELGDVVDADPELREILVGLRLSPEQAAETARYAHVLSAAQDRPVDSPMVREAARRVGGSAGANEVRVESTPGTGHGPGFADLVLPDDLLASLQRLVTWGRHRNQVTAHGPLRRRGRGLAALFAGNPGTGKTLAAHVVAEELGVDLFQVELSAVVDKYIGETQKNLERVFQAAEALDVVLFFDEADAIFGNRSEVHDARDRYANQEIAYLLQRMEQFEGITILATNLRGNLDRAFSRRMSFVLHFPDPDPATRLRLWRYHLAQLPELDEGDLIDVPYLSTAADVTGGDIRNIVLAAAYDAISAGEAVGMRHVVEATVREYRKLGKIVPDHGFTARPVPAR
jgi:hypothetical protein